MEFNFTWFQSLTENASEIKESKLLWPDQVTLWLTVNRYFPFTDNIIIHPFNHSETIY